jgi:hypothetical protein
MPVRGQGGNRWVSSICGRRDKGMWRIRIAVLASGNKRFTVIGRERDELD